MNPTDPHEPPRTVGYEPNSAITGETPSQPPHRPTAQLGETVSCVSPYATGTFQPDVAGEAVVASAVRLLPSIPGYEIEGVLGRGGMGVVYKARHLALRRTVAIKMVLAGGHAGPRERARFSIEVEAAARLQHPNIVQIHEVGEVDGHQYCALEFVEGGNLANKLDGKPMLPRDAAKLVETLGRAMQLAHNCNVVHRDLKPANILLQIGDKGRSRKVETPNSDGSRPGDPTTHDRLHDLVPKITDFGLARQLDSDSGETQAGAVMGTPSYMAPEQAAGRAHEAGPPADIYALGAILYECLVGRPPFVGRTAVETLDRVRTQEPMPPSRAQKSVPHDLDVICLKCLQKHAEKRYASAAELADDLGRYLRGEAIRARPVGRAERLFLWARRRPAPFAVCMLAVLVVVLGGLGGGAVWLWQRAEQASRSLANARDQTETALQGERFARELADQARLREIAANEKLAAANDRLDQLLYLRRIGMAHVGWRENNPVVMERELLACPRPRRRWEWCYLDHLCHSELRAFRFQTDGLALTLSSDGGHLAASGPDGTVRIWEVASGKEVQALPGNGDLRRCLCFSPDAHFLATDSSRTELKIWDTRTGKIVCILPHETTVDAVSFSPDGHSVATCGVDYAVHFWDVRTGKETGVVPKLAAWSAVQRLSFSPDGQLLAVVAGWARVWDVGAGKERSAVQSPGGTPQSVCFSRDGKRLATTWAQGAVRITDPKTGQAQTPPKNHSPPPTSVCFSPDGSVFATGAPDRIVRVWDARTGDLVRTFQGHTGAVRCLAFSADGRRLVSAAADGVAKVWDASTDQDARCLEGATTGSHLAFSSDSQRLAALGQDGTVRVWDTRTGRPAPNAAGAAGTVMGVGFGATGLRVVRRLPRGGVAVRDVETDRPDRPLGGDTDGVGTVCFSPDGRFLAALFPREVRLWDADTGQFLRTLTGPRLGIASIVFSPDGRSLAAGGNVEPYVHVWDVTSGAGRWVLTGHTSGPVFGVAFHPDANRLASIAGDGTVRTWDLRTGQALDIRTADVPSLSGGAGGVCWSPDGQRVVGAWARGTTHLWDVLTGEEVLALPGDGTGHANRERLCFSPDGQLLASCHDGTVRLREARPSR